MDSKVIFTYTVMHYRKYQPPPPKKITLANIYDFISTTLEFYNIAVDKHQQLNCCISEF